MNIPKNKAIIILIFMSVVLSAVILGACSTPIIYRTIKITTTPPPTTVTLPPKTVTLPPTVVTLPPITIISTPITVTVTAIPTPTPDDWEISGLAYKITEQNPVWWRFSWQLTVENNTSYQAEFFIRVNFLDKDGFIIDYDLKYPPIFSPKEERVVRGFVLVDTEIAPNVKSAEVEVEFYIVD